jgi:AAA domain
MPHKDRQAKMKSWREQILGEQAQNISTLGREYNKCIHNLSRKLRWKYAATLSDKRIIGCTTTAPAMYRESIQEDSPDILLVEEAGEILESHVLTALCPATTQLILIGDHKCVSIYCFRSTFELMFSWCRQLRPKVNNRRERGRIRPQPITI